MLVEYALKVHKLMKFVTGTEPILARNLENNTPNPSFEEMRNDR